MSPTVIRFAVLIVLGLIAGAVAWRLQKRRPDPPSAPSYRAPTQLDLADFGLVEESHGRSGDGSSVPAADKSDRSRMIVVFGSELCASCEGVWTAVQAVTQGKTPSKLVNVEDSSELHKRYRIDGVPTLVVIDNEGVVHNAFFGPITNEALAEALPGEGN